MSGRARARRTLSLRPRQGHTPGGRRTGRPADGHHVPPTSGGAHRSVRAERAALSPPPQVQPTAGVGRHVRPPRDGGRDHGEERAARGDHRVARPAPGASLGRVARRGGACVSACSRHCSEERSERRQPRVPGNVMRPWASNAVRRPPRALVAITPVGSWLGGTWIPRAARSTWDG